MLQSSQDLLYIVLAFCVLWFTIFLCWALYYVIMFLRDVRNTSETIRDTARGIKDKINSFGTAAAVAVTGLTEALHFIQEHRTSKSSKVNSKDKAS